MTQITRVRFVAIQHGNIPSANTAEGFVPLEASVDPLQPFSKLCDIHAGMDPSQGIGTTEGLSQPFVPQPR